MKKTLCKTIHNQDKNIFIGIEDISCVTQNNTNPKIISIYSRGYDELIYRYSFKSEEKANEFQKNIIKELEEYYGLDSSR